MDGGDSLMDTDPSTTSKMEDYFSKTPNDPNSTQNIVSYLFLKNIINKANNAFDFGRWKEAFMLYNEAHLLLPTCGHVLFRLGVMHHTGLQERSEVILQKDKDLANHYFALAMEELKKYPDDPEALCDLGYMNESGYGSPKNAKEAVKYYILSAEMGYSRGQCNLAYMYEYGEGCEKDSKKAEKYYTLSANHGLARGQCNLGFMYNNGAGVEKDPKKSRRVLQNGCKTRLYQSSVQFSTFISRKPFSEKISRKIFQTCIRTGT